MHPTRRACGRGPGSDEQKKRLLPKLVSGESIGTVAFAEKAGHNGVEAVEARVAGGKLSGSKLPVPDGQAADLAVVPKRVLARMGLNVLIDMLLGAIPVVGDLFDVGFKANRRNIALLKRALGEGRTPR